MTDPKLEPAPDAPDDEQAEPANDPIEEPPPPEPVTEGE